MRDFSAKQVLESAGILCVFQGFQWADLPEKIHCSAGIHFPMTTLIKGLSPPFGHISGNGRSQSAAVLVVDGVAGLGEVLSGLLHQLLHIQGISFRFN